VNYVEAIVARHTSYSTAMAGTAAVVFVMAAVAAVLGPERRAVRFGESD